MGRAIQGPIRVGSPMLLGRHGMKEKLSRQGQTCVREVLGCCGTGAQRQRWARLHGAGRERVAGLRILASDPSPRCLADRARPGQ